MTKLERFVPKIVVIAGLLGAGMMVSVPNGARAEGMCDMMWKPVCGKEGTSMHTYSNACWAKMHKVKILYMGECKWK